MSAKKRILKVSDVDVEHWDFGYAQFYYPAFNGNAEFPVTSKGFRRLSSYIRTVKYFQKQITPFLFQTTTP